MAFNTAGINFGQRKAKPVDPHDPEGEGPDPGDGIPEPHRLTASRRFAEIKKAAEVLRHMPQPGESIHLICTARIDLTDIMDAMIGQTGTVKSCAVSTLGYNPKNLKLMLRWLDNKAMRGLTLITSKFFTSYHRGLWEETELEFAERGQRAAACYSHAKVCTLHFENGMKIAIEGSANLCGNGSGREQCCIINDAGLHDWHEAWMMAMVEKFEAWKKSRT